MLRAGRRWVRRMRGAHVHLILEALQARRELEANSAVCPFAGRGNYILGDKGDRYGPANKLVLFRAGLRCDERKGCRGGGRRNGYKAAIGGDTGVEDEL